MYCSTASSTSPWVRDVPVEADAAEVPGGRPPSEPLQPVPSSTRQQATAPAVPARARTGPMVLVRRAPSTAPGVAPWGRSVQVAGGRRQRAAGRDRGGGVLQRGQRDPLGE